MPDYYDAYPDMTPEEEAKAELEAALDEVRWPIEEEGYEAALDEQAPRQPLRATDCKTTADWEQWARERREYDDPYGYERSRY